MEPDTPRRPRGEGTPQPAMADGAQQPNGQPSPCSPFLESPAPPPPPPPAAPERLDGRWQPRAEAGLEGADGGGSPRESGPGAAREERPAPLGKKKHRRRPSKKKRHWKPYYKLSWEEKQRFDEKQSLRASRLRAEMFAKGQPVAPYNTTQFLMDDHDQEEPDLKTGLRPAAAADDSSEDELFVEEPEEGGGSDGMGGEGGGSEFLQRDFSETYERFHVESLQNMSKQELVREYLELEKCLSRLEDENNRLRTEAGGRKPPGGGGGGGGAGEPPEAARLRQLEQELDLLRAENQRLLQRENQRLLDGAPREQPPPLPQAAGE